jgi:EmrB/QacA subfamily drug resistance transporter
VSAEATLDASLPTTSPALLPRLVVGICALSVFVVSLDTTALYVAFPAIRSDFASTTVEQLSWVLNGYTVIYGALLVVMGRLADQLGRRRVFQWGLGLFGVTSLLSALAPNAEILILARILQGVGSAALVPASLAIALGAVEQKQRNLVAALWSATGALASAVGPSLGALLVASWSWRGVFLINVPVVLIAMAASRTHVAESRDVALAHFPRMVPVISLVLASSLLGLALVEGRAWGVPVSAALAVAGVLVMAFFVVTELRAVRPSFDLTLFRSRAFAVANLAMLIYGVGFAAMFLGFVFFLTEAWGYTVLEAGLAISPGPITVVPVAILAARLGQRVGQRPLAVLGGLFTAAGAVLLALSADGEPSFFLRWLPAALLSGVGVGLVMPTLNGAAVSTLPAERFAVGSAIHQAVRQMGGVLGVALAILLSTLDAPFPLLFGAVAITALATSTIALALPR